MCASISTSASVIYAILNSWSLNYKKREHGRQKKGTVAQEALGWLPALPVFWLCRWATRVEGWIKENTRLRVAPDLMGDTTKHIIFPELSAKPNPNLSSNPNPNPNPNPSLPSLLQDFSD